MVLTALILGSCCQPIRLLASIKRQSSRERCAIKYRPFTTTLHMHGRGDYSATGQTSRTCSGVGPDMWIAFCTERSQQTFRCNYLPYLISQLTSKQRRYLA